MSSPGCFTYFAKLAWLDFTTFSRQIIWGLGKKLLWTVRLILNKGLSYLWAGSSSLTWLSGGRGSFQHLPHKCRGKKKKKIMLFRMAKSIRYWRSCSVPGVSCAGCCHQKDPVNELATSGNHFCAPINSSTSITPIALEWLSKALQALALWKQAQHCRLCSLEVTAKSPKSQVTHQPGAEQVLGLLLAITPSPGCRSTTFEKLICASNAHEP